MSSAKAFQSSTHNGTQTLDRSVALLKIIASQGHQGADIETLMETSRLSRTTLYRLLKALKRHGLVRVTRERGHYLLGYELFSLGAQAGNNCGIRELSRPALLRLARTFGERFFLFVEDGYHVLCAELQGGHHRTASFTQSIGQRIPFGVGQASLAILAHLPSTQRTRILNHNAPLLARQYSIDIIDVLSLLKTIRHQDYTCGLPDTFLSDYTGVAVPLIDKEGLPLGALSCALPRARLTPPYLLSIADAMRHEAHDIMLYAHSH